MGRGSNRHATPSGGSGGGSGGTATGIFTAPTSGLEDVKFASGTPESAATYEKSLEQLTNYLRTQPWKGVSVLTQAIERMENLVLPEPEEPERKYYTDDTRMVTSDEPNNVNNTPRVPVVTDTLYAVLLQKYLTDHARWETKDTLYKENRSRAYNLFLQHCPTPLRTELKQAEK